jgi:hypothetical protein
MGLISVDKKCTNVLRDSTTLLNNLVQLPVTSNYRSLEAIIRLTLVVVHTYCFTKSDE